MAAPPQDPSVVDATQAPVPPKMAPSKIEPYSLSLRGLFVIALFGLLFEARALFMPLTLAVLLFFLLIPIVRWLKRWKVKEGLGAFLLICAMLGATIYAFYSLTIPAADWLNNAPQNLRKLESKLNGMRAPVEKMREATKRMEEISTLGSEKAPEVSVKNDPPVARLFSAGSDFLEGALVLIVLLYFLLASGDSLLGKIVSVLPRVEDKIKAVELARQIESEIGHYLLTLSLVNAIHGAAVGLTMFFLGMPTPALWGVMAALLEFIPYLGAACTFFVLSGVALVTFDSVGHALLVPACFMAIDLVVENYLNPVLVGKQLALNPVVIFLMLAIGGYLWGVIGVLVAVPVLVVIKVFCDRIESYRFIGELISA